MSAPDPPRRPTDADGPRTRAEQQARTRDALLDAAQLVFARDGYAGAGLEQIAREAGFSKGAVYSNFEGKADLFLAVLDVTLEGLRDDGWDPTAADLRSEELAAVAAVGFDDPPTVAQLARGLGLATLEFVASSGRDPALAEPMRDRIGVLVRAYTRIAARRRAAHEHLDDATVGALLAAFDQGFALFTLLGWPGLDVTTLPEGLTRLLHPATEPPAPEPPAPEPPAPEPPAT